MGGGLEEGIAYGIVGAFADSYRNGVAGVVRVIGAIGYRAIRHVGHFDYQIKWHFLRMQGQ